MLGVGLGLVVVVVVSAITLILADHLAGGDGTAGVAASSTAGNAAAVPTLVAAANPSYAPAAASATVLVAASVIINRPAGATSHCFLEVSRTKKYGQSTSSQLGRSDSCERSSFSLTTSPEQRTLRQRMYEFRSPVHWLAASMRWITL